MNTLATIALLLAAAGAVAAFWTLRRLQEERARVTALQNDLRALCNSAVNVGARINAVEQRLRQLSLRQDQLGMQQQGAGEGRSFDQAAKMVRKGASIDEVVDVCGLSRGEAELVAMMQRLEANK
jgi:hypothetical protein